MSFQLSFASETEVGRVRKYNEDCVAFDADCSSFVVADGMGGHNAGEIASAMAVHLTLDALSDLVSSGAPHDSLEAEFDRILSQINTSIVAAGKNDPAKKGMGTTIVIGLFLDGYLHFAHVGDSRLYLFRQGFLTPLTQDHTLQQEMINERPDEMSTIVQEVPSNIVTRCLGVQETVEVSYSRAEVQSGDVFLASTDGLHDAMDHVVLEELVRSIDELQEGAKRIIAEANSLYGKDNLTLLLVRVGADNEKWNMDKVLGFGKKLFS